MTDAQRPAEGTAALPAAVLVGGVDSNEIDFLPVHQRLAPILDRAVLLGEIPVLGSPSWVEIPDEDRRWRDSVVVAGYRWAMTEWLRQDAENQASKELSGSADWSAVAARTRRRAEYLAANPWARRHTA